MNAIQARTIGTKRNRNGTLIKTKQQRIKTNKEIKRNRNRIRTKTKQQESEQSKKIKQSKQSKTKK